MVIPMIIIWSMVIAGALLLEFMTNDMTSVWFAAGGLAALVTAPFDLFWPWQVLIFFIVSFAFLACLRPITRKYVHAKTVPTNLDINIGKHFKLTRDIVDGRGEIKIGDTFWTVAAPHEGVELKTGTEVKIIGMEGNKYIVKKGEIK
jgi:membrane protein implicated in regulation of membrane protease activity